MDQAFSILIDVLTQLVSVKKKNTQQNYYLHTLLKPVNFTSKEFTLKIMVTLK